MSFGGGLADYKKAPFPEEHKMPSTVHYVERPSAYQAGFCQELDDELRELDLSASILGLEDDLEGIERAALY